VPVTVAVALPPGDAVTTTVELLAPVVVGLKNTC
jgi:hypothetical protein